MKRGLVLPAPWWLILGVVLVAASYAAGPPPAHTGGFGEPTCHTCHFDHAPNAPGTSLSLDGLPAAFHPGRPYRFVVRLSRNGLARGGFQLSARDADGKQAGVFSYDDDRLDAERSGGVLYLRHLEAGTAPTSADSIAWVLTWTAPDTARGPVFFHTAANAADGDDSPFGDFVVTRADTVRPSRYLP